MQFTVVIVHPSIVVCRHEGGQFELPRQAFPAEPQPGQKWDITLDHESTDEEKIADLNALLPRLP
jgi:hypothetical protein